MGCSVWGWRTSQMSLGTKLNMFSVKLTQHWIVFDSLQFVSRDYNISLWVPWMWNIHVDHTVSLSPWANFSSDMLLNRDAHLISLWWQRMPAMPLLLFLQTSTGSHIVGGQSSVDTMTDLKISKVLWLYLVCTASHYVLHWFKCTL